MRPRTLILLALLAVGAAGAAEAPPPVEAVAGDAMVVLYDGEEARLVGFRFPPGAGLPDHATGPRAVLILSDGAIRRAADPEGTAATQVTGLTALWLDSEVGAAFTNAAATELRYLVFEPRGEPTGQTCTPELLLQGPGSLRPNLDRPEVMVWRLDVAGTALLQLAAGSQRALLVQDDGLVTALFHGDVLPITTGTAFLFCRR